MNLLQTVADGPMIFLMEFDLLFRVYPTVTGSAFNTVLTISIHVGLVSESIMEDSLGQHRGLMS